DDGGGEALDRIYECFDVMDASAAIGFNKQMQEKKIRLLRECVLLSCVTSFDRMEEVIVSPMD
nr:hypothetical protein [Tanacetum cinerariifolium]